MKISYLNGMDTRDTICKEIEDYANLHPENSAYDDYDVIGNYTVELFNTDDERKALIAFAACIVNTIRDIEAFQKT